MRRLGHQKLGEGLRDRKKAATHAALCNAALKLAVERGLDGFRITDIAKAAGVSPRTFNNYFDSKEAAVVASGEEQVEQLVSALRLRPVDEDPWTALGKAAGALFAKEPDRDWMVRASLLQNHPSLAAAQRKADLKTEVRLATEIAERIGADSTRDVLPKLLSAAAISAVHVAFELWRESRSSTLRSIILKVFGCLSLTGTKNKDSTSQRGKKSNRTTRGIPARRS